EVGQLDRGRRGEQLAGGLVGRPGQGGGVRFVNRQRHGTGGTGPAGHGGGSGGGDGRHGGGSGGCIRVGYGKSEVHRLALPSRVRRQAGMRDRARGSVPKNRYERG
ncbi:hypothetical protein EAD89_29095, partial [Micromonospora sp. BL4]